MVRQYPATLVVGSVDITSPFPASLAVGNTFQLTVLVQSTPQPPHNLAQTLTGRLITYTSSNPAVATVSSGGLVTAVAAGTATITATSEGVSDSETATVVTTQGAVASVTVTPATATLNLSATQVYQAVVKDAAGKTLTGKTVTWASSNTAVATVGADSGPETHQATVTAVAAGTATITATSDAVGGTATATVVVATLDNTAELPREQVATTFAMPTTIYRVKTAGGDFTPAQFQSALDTAAAQTSAVIVIDDGLVITGSFTVPGRSGAGWVYVVSNAVHAGTFPRALGVRVLAADTPSMAKLQTSAVNQSILTFNTGATPPARYRFVGLEATSTVTGTVGIQGSLIQVNGGDPDVNRIPRDLIFDRCYLHAQPGTNFVRRGFFLDGIRCAVVESRVSGMVDGDNSDSQAVLLLNAPGPILLRNNYLEAASENVMSGGGASLRAPADITITRNHCKKLASWVGVYPTKNLIELKFGQRVLIEQNIFENVWNSGQTGNAVVLKSTSQTGTGDGAQYIVTDVTIRHNHIKNADWWLSLSAAQEDSTQTMARVSIHHNLFAPLRAGGTGDVQVLKGSSAIPITGGLYLHNNTLDVNRTYWSWFMDPGAAFIGTKATAIHVFDNVLGCGQSPDWDAGPVGASGQVGGLSNLTAQWTTVVMLRNGIYGSGPGSGGYDASNLFTGNKALASVQFTNVAAGDYSLAPTSPFKGIGLAGADPGIDQADLNSKLAGVAD